MVFNDKRDWTAIVPVPKDIPFPNLETHMLLNYQLKDAELDDLYKYTTEKDETIGYVVRLIDNENRKRMPTLSYCQHVGGTISWTWKEFDGFPIYNLYELIQNPDKPVLIVEGEKAADAAKTIFPDFVVITWYGGSSTIRLPDWSVLKDRRITLWPDADLPGKDAMNSLLTRLITQDVISISTVEHAFNRVALPLGWDLGDTMPEEWQSPEALQAVLDNRKVLYIDMGKDSRTVNREPTL